MTPRHPGRSGRLPRPSDTGGSPLDPGMAQPHRGVLHTTPGGTIAHPRPDPTSAPPQRHYTHDPWPHHRPPPGRPRQPPVPLQTPGVPPTTGGIGRHPGQRAGAPPTSAPPHPSEGRLPTPPAEGNTTRTETADHTKHRLLRLTTLDDIKPFFCAAEAAK